MTHARVWIGLIGSGLLFSAVGCVAQAEYDAQTMANRKLREELELSRIELQDARNQAELARGRLGTIENEMRTKDQLVDNLATERDRHLDAFQKAQLALAGLAARAPMNPVVLTQALPPALDRALRDFAGKYPDRVEFDSRRGIVKWKSDLLFALGSAVVVDSAKEVLQSFSEIMNSDAAQRFEVNVVGHTDNTPISRPETRRLHPTNWHLSTHRAISVMTVLRNFGIGEDRMAVMGFGEHRPLDPNPGESAKARNRRVEIYVVPKDAVALADAGQPGSDQSGKPELFRPTVPDSVK